MAKESGSGYFKGFTRRRRPAGRDHLHRYHGGLSATRTNFRVKRLDFPHVDKNDLLYGKLFTDTRNRYFFGCRTQHTAVSDANKTTFIDTAPRYNTMQMRMKTQVLSPSMQNTNHSELPNCQISILAIWQFGKSPRNPPFP